MNESTPHTAEHTSTASAWASIGLDKDHANVPYFAASGGGGRTPAGGTFGGITLNTGDIDLSGFPPGDVPIKITLDDDAYNAGYRFPVDPYQAIGIATWPAGGV